VDYIVRISFSTPHEGSSLPLEAQAEQIMARLMPELADGADEAEIVHRRIFVASEARLRPMPWIPLPCVRCRRFGVVSFERYCTACWAITR
jgi:hypothetical protein